MFSLEIWEGNYKSYKCEFAAGHGFFGEQIYFCLGMNHSSNIIDFIFLQKQFGFLTFLKVYWVFLLCLFTQTFESHPIWIIIVFDRPVISYSIFYCVFLKIQFQFSKRKFHTKFLWFVRTLLLNQCSDLNSLFCSIRLLCEIIMLNFCFIISIKFRLVWKETPIVLKNLHL